jgi:hypothetical protein
MIDDDDAVRAALLLAADDVRPPDDLTSRVRAAGRRRVRRHRALTATAVVTVVAVLGAVAVGGLRWTARPPATSTPLSQLLLENPTTGNLADDAAFLRRAVDAYQRTRAQTPLKGLVNTEAPIGAPHVVWAGTTPVGPAAAVAQRVPKKDARTAVLLGFFGAGPDGTLEHVASALDHQDEPLDGIAFLVGTQRSVLVVLDTGVPVEYSVDRVYKTDRVVRVDWKQVGFVDGAAVVGVPPQRDRYSVAVRIRSGEYLPLANLNDPAVLPDRPTLGWGTEPGPAHPGREAAWLPVGPAATTPAKDQHGALLGDAERAYALLAEGVDVACAGRGPSGVMDKGCAGDGLVALGLDWVAYGRTPDGLLFVAADFSFLGDPVRGIAVIRRSDGAVVPMIGAPVDRAAPLPIMLRLPDGHGWLVARKGATLEYRASTGPWQAAGHSAALLPASATKVRANGTAMVALPRS